MHNFIIQGTFILHDVTIPMNSKLGHLDQDHYVFLFNLKLFSLFIFYSFFSLYKGIKSLFCFLFMLFWLKLHSWEITQIFRYVFYRTPISALFYVNLHFCNQNFLLHRLNQTIRLGVKLHSCTSIPSYSTFWTLVKKYILTLFNILR